MVTHRAVISLGLMLAATGCASRTGKVAPIGPGEALSGPPDYLLFDETYVAGVMGAEYLLPFGPYLPEGRDSRGVYYKAPIPIKKRGLFGGLLGSGSLVDGGLFLSTGSGWPWLYLREEDGSIRSAPLRELRLSKGVKWHERYGPLEQELDRP